MSPFPAQWRIRDRVLALDRPCIVGILNVTPDSFSDGGRFVAPDDAIAHGLQMLDDGADVLDIGGESTRPQGAKPVGADEEIDRILPAIVGILRERPDCVLSVDTSKEPVARAAIDAGARIVNDVSGLRFDPAIATVCARTGAGLVLMHSRGDVSTMGTFTHAHYENVVSEVAHELRASVDVAVARGLSRDQIVVDPGIGFAKKTEHSIAMLRAIPTLVSWGFPVFVGVSRKRFIGDLAGARDPYSRLHGTLGANVAALALGARIFRVHDVREHREALAVAFEILTART